MLCTETAHLGRLLVTATLHEDIENSPMLIHCSPGIVDLAMDGKEDLIQIPLVPGVRLTVTQGIGIPEVGLGSL